MLHNHILTTIVASHRTAKTLNQFLKCIEPQIKLILLLHYHILTNARREKRKHGWTLSGSLLRLTGAAAWGASVPAPKGGRPQDLQEPAWDETKEEEQRAPWAPSLPNLGSNPRATHLPNLGLKEDGGFGLQVAELPELAGGGGVAGGRWGRRGRRSRRGLRLRPAGGGPPRASRRRRRCRWPAGSAGTAASACRRRSSPS